MTSKSIDSLHMVQPTDVRDRYPDPRDALEATLQPNPNHAAKLAVQLAADRAPTPEDIRIDASLARIHQALDSRKKA